MESAIHIGASVDKESASNLKDVIVGIFDSGKKNDMDQSTIVKALDVVVGTFDVSGVTVTNSTFKGDNVVNQE